MNRYAGLTPQQIAALERRYDGPITDEQIANFKRLWEWQNRPGREAWVEPAGVWEKVLVDGS
jgi:hypothetical protein